MCTSITLKSADKKFLMARTMDFSFELEPEFVVYPRNASIQFMKIAKPLDNHYAFMGLGKNIGTYQLADGVNEHGLTIAALYFESYVQYAQEVEGVEAIAAHEVVQYALATCKTADDVIAMFNNIPVVAAQIAFLGIVPPLHWTVQDANGKAVIIEMTKYGVEVHDNNLGVLTNSPNYEWHLTNLRNYIGMDPKQVQPRTLYGQEFKPFGQGSGTFGLPGDFTSPSRFIKTLYNKLSANTANDETELVIQASHILNAVDIPKGSVITQRDTIDYTQYSSYIINSTQAYYYRLYNSFEIKKHSLADFDLDGNTLVVLEA